MPGTAGKAVVSQLGNKGGSNTSTACGRMKSRALAGLPEPPLGVVTNLCFADAAWPRSMVDGAFQG